MREIKFRAWEPVNSTMLDVVSFNIELQTIQSQYDEEHKLCNIELMQYTGLKDKNGVEIYEGDMFEARLGRFVVTFEDAAFFIDPVYIKSEDGSKIENSYMNDKIALYMMKNIESVEIIGNIYEDTNILDI